MTGDPIRMMFPCQKCGKMVEASSRTEAGVKLPCCGVTMAEGCPPIDLNKMAPMRNYVARYKPRESLSEEHKR